MGNLLSRRRCALPPRHGLAGDRYQPADQVRAAAWCCQARRHARLHGRAAWLGLLESVLEAAASKPLLACAWVCKCCWSTAKRATRPAWACSPGVCASLIWPGACSPMAATSRCRKWVGTRSIHSAMGRPELHPLQWTGIAQRGVFLFRPQLLRPAAGRRICCAAEADYGGRFAASLRATTCLRRNSTPENARRMVWPCSVISCTGTPEGLACRWIFCF